MTRSVRWRLWRRGPVRLVIPQISPYIDRLRLAATGGHQCEPFAVRGGLLVPMVWSRTQ